MRFDEHPTWRMLEDGKNYFKYLAGSSFDLEISKISTEAFSALCSLQLQLENNLIEKLGDSED
jgi:hypothetical protein